MRYFSLGHRLPGALSVPLFGDRRRYGQEPFPGDPCWQEWQEIYEKFYLDTQHAGVHKVVNHSGYKVMRLVDLSDKRVVEIGPGTIAHIDQWRGPPSHYDLLDVNESMMREAVKVLAGKSIAFNTYLLQAGNKVSFPFPSHSYDVVVSFYSMEHLHPLESYLEEILRVLKPGGCLVGAIPCEGGIGWGLGRLFTTRRWFKANSNIDPDKWVCWEHPNFAETIVHHLDMRMRRKHVSYFPFPFLPLIDPNLILRFLHEKK